ncbi:hypothetical protein MRB53_002073 [Persea americana]|uniref:Uncharacterized protein n=1 Tax=Persea americana TaxID=3435 RepID=A0ACC2MTR2_PERAE|nr:hypothetical protein MRB53_002073 [Persea americana]|eukprot:TRINITY_DN36007_c0_g2_i1.p1 TRINITY_DN36007_c0_g2~~TRINITY_DN36007_c0_g2_i1.p1  ORF type:complete len:168 (+),score=11.51 TRINITY_DN36007_c0_g2_i1:125-628(+)
MTAPNMAMITTALERSLQNCSLSSSPSPNSTRSANQANDETSDSSLELNSHLALPYEWEQCLDLKTGEIYYINWRNGMKVKEDPRAIEPFEGGYDSEEDSSEESEGSSAASSPRSRDDCQRYGKDHVLVVAGCKSCLMYFMLPKTVFECPKCNGTILHFDREENGYL